MPISKERFEDRPEERPLIPPHSGHVPASSVQGASGVAPTGQTQPVVVQGQPLAAAAAEPPKPRPDRPDPNNPGVTRDGGLYIHQDGKTVIDAEGRPVKGFTVQDGGIVEGASQAEDKG
jgi:hypothetical protein